MGMNLDNRRSAQTTQYEVVDPLSPEEDTGVVITGHAPKSHGWEKAHRKVYGAPKKQTVIYDKDRRYSEIDNGTPAQQAQMLAAVVTNVVGIDQYNGEPWKFSEENVAILFADPAMHWLVTQWDKHLNSLEGFIKPPAKDASRGRKSTDG